MLVHHDRCYAIYSLFYPERLHVYQVFVFIDAIGALGIELDILICRVKLMQIFQIDWS